MQKNIFYPLFQAGHKIHHHALSSLLIVLLVTHLSIGGIYLLQAASSRSTSPSLQKTISRENPPTKTLLPAGDVGYSESDSSSMPLAPMETNLVQEDGPFPEDRATSPTPLAQEKNPNPTAVVIDIYANPIQVPIGGTSEVAWSVSGSTSCTGSWQSGNISLSGSIKTVSLLKPTLYSISCIDFAHSGAIIRNSVNISVKPVSITLKASPVIVENKGTSTIGWETSGASKCRSSWSGDKTSLNGGYMTKPLTATTSYELQCENEFGYSTGKTVTVRLIPSNPTSLTAKNVGLLVNDNDSGSVEIARYYQQKRGIPDKNIIHFNLPLKNQLTVEEFAPIREKIYRDLPKDVQVIAVAWTNPSRVNCNSITSAIARGYIGDVCSGQIFSAEKSPYYDSYTQKPYTELGIRPAMMLAGWTVDDVKAMIDRGVASDKTLPRGSSYIMKTSDSIRSLRANIFPSTYLGYTISKNIDTKIVQTNSITGTTDALFYFQGLASVPNLSKNTYPAGAVGDHLTSFGGRLTDSSQMSILEFIRAGFTASYGTVTEPYATSTKFPDPAIMMTHYTRGETVIEAYWKSVLDTAQGIFVGEPLARPWGKDLPSDIIKR